MELKNYYWYFKGALSKDVCNKIINLGTSTIEDDKKITLILMQQLLVINKNSVKILYRKVKEQQLI